MAAYTDIDKPSDHFNVVKYTPDGNAGFNVTGVGFQPDFVWAKSLKYSEDWQMVDSIRGVQTAVQSNLASTGGAQAQGLTSFDSDGFTVGNLSDWNYNNDDINAYCWKAATSNSTNTNGDVNSTVRANQTAGFSVVTATSTATSGNTSIGHGIGKNVDMIFARNLAQNFNWDCWFRETGYTGTHILNSGSTGRTGFGSGTNDSNVFSALYNYSAYNGNEYVYYCFSSVKGYQKIGKYEGNGVDDGTFVNCGFKPAFILIKCTESGEHWNIPHSNIPGFNGDIQFISPNLPNSLRNMDDNPGIDILSNGFKIRTSDNNLNKDQDEFVYLAIAENPFVSSGGVPATAR